MGESEEGKRNIQEAFSNLRKEEAWDPVQQLKNLTRSGWERERSKCKKEELIENEKGRCFLKCVGTTERKKGPVTQAEKPATYEDRV